MKHTHITLLLIFIFSSSLLNAGDGDKKNKKNYTPTDAQGSLPKNYNYKANKDFSKIKATSMYLTMRDSVKIAVNVYVPKGLKEGEKLPAILYQTRYWRGASFRWPFSMFIDNFAGNAGIMMKEVVLNGYVLVAVDSRGSGASFGNRLHPWTADEIKDGAEIVDWIIEQEWSNGNVGAAGISYSGTTSEMLLVNMHPAVKAVAPMFALYDVYDDISFPGGIQLKGFTKSWGEANAALDKNKLPASVKGITRFVVKGVQPVKGEKKQLKLALIDHKANLNVHDGAKVVDYRDDIPAQNQGVIADVFSPHSFVDKINVCGAAIYSVSGYFDGDYQHAAIKRYLNCKNPFDKLIIGPWEHGGWMNCSPANPGPSAFKKEEELLKFFDYHLKGKETGIYNEDPVHYFTMVEEKWKSSKVWPPKETEYQTWYIQPNKTVSTSLPVLKEGKSLIKVDSTWGAGIHSRWMSLTGQLKIPTAYPDWQERTDTLLNFSSSELDADMEVTGHPIVTLYVKSTDTDGAFFVYLSDIDENGKVNYVTEGEIRGICRKVVAADQRNHTDVEAIPYHSYLKEDAMPLVPGETAVIDFDLLPVSYLFKKGHKFRITITGADKDHFEIIAPNAEFEILHNRIYPTKIELPVINK